MAAPGTVPLLCPHGPYRVFPDGAGRCDPAAPRIEGCRKKFFPAYLWLVTKTLMEQPAFCTAEMDGVLGVFDTRTPLYTAFHEDDKTFSLMWTAYNATTDGIHISTFLETLQRYADGFEEFLSSIPPRDETDMGHIHPAVVLHPGIGCRHAVALRHML